MIMTTEDLNIYFSKMTMRAAAEYMIAHNADVRYFREYKYADIDDIQLAVRLEAYGASMYGTPEYI